MLTLKIPVWLKLLYTKKILMDTIPNTMFVSLRTI